MPRIGSIDTSRYSVSISRDLQMSPVERRPGPPARSDGLTVGIAHMTHDAPHGGGSGEAFREELGAERANRIAWKALEKMRTEIVRELAKALPAQATNLERFLAYNKAGAPMIGDAVDFEWHKNEDDRVEFDVTGCRFAKFFRQLGEPELGFALLCSFDNTAVDEIAKDDVKFTRTQTIMQGGDHCDFRYALKKKGLA